MDDRGEKHELIKRDSEENFLELFKEKTQKAFSWITSEESKIIVKIIASLTSSSIGDPTGLVIPLILDCADSLVRKRFLKHIPDLTQKIEAINTLNLKYVESEEGRKLLKDTMKQIIHETNEDKIGYLKQFLVKSYSEKNTDSERVTNFFKILSNMEPIHMKLLRVLKNPREIILEVCEQRKQNPRPEGKRPYGKLDSATFWEDHGMDDLNEFYLHSDPLVYVNGHKDLVTWNIIEAKFHHFWLYFQPSTFDSNIDTHIRGMQRWTTPFGEEFLKYVYNDSKETKESL